MISIHAMRHGLDLMPLPSMSRLNVYDIGWELCICMFLPFLFSRELISNFFLACFVR